MARQTGPNFFTGKHDMLCFYKWGDKYFCRLRSSLSAETVKKSPKFANSRKSAAELGAASKLASQVYRRFSKARRNVSLYRRMTGIAKLMLKEGKPVELIIATLNNSHLANSHLVRGKPVRDQLVDIEGSGQDESTDREKQAGMMGGESPAADRELVNGEPKRYFKMSVRTVVEINAAIDSTFIELRDFLKSFRPLKKPNIKLEAG